MPFTARLFAALLLAFASVQLLTPLPVDAAGGKQTCAARLTEGKRCAGSQRRAGRSMRSPGNAIAPAQSRAWPFGRKKVYAGNEIAMRQLSPRLRARRVSTLRPDGREPFVCIDANARRSCAYKRSSADPLVQTPTAATAKIFRENGLPIIPGVPPIVIFRPAGELWPEDVSGGAP